MPDLPIAVATIVVSLMLLMYSADHLVRGASSLATRIGVSALFTGMVVVGAATSAPEMATTVVAAADGAFGIAVGNIVGSNIANLALVLGVAGAMAPIRVSRAVFRRDGSMLVAASIALMGVALLPQPIVGRLAGIGALIALSLYTMYAFHGERNLKAVVDELERAAEEILHPDPLLVAIIRSAASLVLLVISAGLFVDNARAIGSALGVPESVLGLTVAAIGTSLPGTRRHDCRHAAQAQRCGTGQHPGLVPVQPARHRRRRGDHRAADHTGGHCPDRHPDHAGHHHHDRNLHRQRHAPEPP